nr:MAG TPA: hypothetical protein [Caudoviricetes sp.]
MLDLLKAYAYNIKCKVVKQLTHYHKRKELNANGK